MHPVPAPPPRPPSALAPWIGVGLTLAALLTATSVMGAPAATPNAGAARWLPPDGSRQAFVVGDASQALEWSRPPLHSLIQYGSPTFSIWAGITETDWQEAAYLRVAGHSLDERATAATTTENLWVVEDAGARTIAESASDAGDTIWEPGRLDLPADLAVGSTWTSQGAVAFRPPGGEWVSAEYQADYRAMAPADPAEQWRGCVVVAMELTVNGQKLPSDRTWCPGAGVIAGDDGDNTWVPAETLPRLPLAEPPDFDWSRADELEFTHRTHSQPGTGMTFLSPVSAPAALPDGTLVFANGAMPDLIALDPTTDPPPLRWVARPGGSLTSANGFAGLTVVTTSRRALIGYGPQGQWLWQTRLSDLTRVPPVLLGADTVVVVTLDGGITGYDLATGEERWRARMDAEIRRPPLVAGDRLLVADADGALSCLDADGQEQWTIDAGRVRSLAVSSGPDPVVAVGRSDSYVVSGYSLADGSRAWRERILQDARDLISLGDRFVLRDDDQLIAIEATDGARLWSSPMRSAAAIGGGGRILLLTADALVLIDAEGNPVREWPHQLGGVSPGYLALSGGQVVVSGPTGFAVGRTP